MRKRLIAVGQLLLAGAVGSLIGPLARAGGAYESWSIEGFGLTLAMFICAWFYGAVGGAAYQKLSDA